MILGRQVPRVNIKVEVPGRPHVMILALGWNWTDVLHSIACDVYNYCQLVLDSHLHIILNASIRNQIE